MNVTDGISTRPLKEIDAYKYQVIYFAGGHGTMWDFPANPEIDRLASAIYMNDGIVAAVCHGPSALVDVRLPGGKYLIEGKEINSFTDAEEREVKKDKIVPFLLESRLRERGAKFIAAKNWSEIVIVSERLITGQNPQSASALGKAIVMTFDRIQQSSGMNQNMKHNFEKRI
jgi:putative intracellular protease/amidase